VDKEGGRRLPVLIQRSDPGHHLIDPCLANVQQDVHRACADGSGRPV
jgi:hypothetical protein